MMAIRERQKALLWGDRLARWSISLIFIFAAVPKIFDVQEFAKTIKAYAILPDVLIFPTAIILPVAEVALAVGLLFNSWICKMGGAALLLMFIALLSYSIWVGLDIDCGCFGPTDPEYSAFHGLREALLRDILMLLPVVYTFWYHRYRSINFQIHGEKQQ
jgi:hypothetical protein